MATDTLSRDAAPTVGRDGGLWVGQVRSFAGRYVRELLRNRTVLFWSIAFPVGFYLLTITVFVDTSQIPSEALPAVLASTAISYGTFGAVIVCLNSFGQQLAADMEGDRYKQYRALPVAPTADVAGRMLAGLGLAVVSFLAVVATGLVTGASFSVRGLPSIGVAVLAFGSFTVVWMVLAIVVAALVTDERYATILTVAMALLSYMLTGYNGTNPAAFAGPDAILNYLPNTLPTRLLVYQFVDSSASALAPPPLPGTLWGLATMAVYTAVTLATGVVVVRTVIYKRGVLA